MTDIQYIVGSAVAIEAAISELRAARKTEEIGLISKLPEFWNTYRLLHVTSVVCTNEQNGWTSRLSVKQAVSYARDQPYEIHSAPTIEALTPATLKDQIIADSLSPSEFRPVFSVNP